VEAIDPTYLSKMDAPVLPASLVAVLTRLKTLPGSPTDKNLESAEGLSTNKILESVLGRILDDADSVELVGDLACLYTPQEKEGSKGK